MNEFIYSFLSADSIKINNSYNRLDEYLKQTTSSVKKYFLLKDTLYYIVEDLLVRYQTIINHANSIKQIYLLSPNQQKPEYELLWDSIVRLMQENDSVAKTNLYLWQKNIAEKYRIILQ